MCPIESARVFITNANAYGDQSISWRVGLGKDNQVRRGRFLLFEFLVSLLKDQQEIKNWKKLQMKKIESTSLYRRCARIYRLLLVVVTIRREKLNP